MSAREEMLRLGIEPPKPIHKAKVVSERGDVSPLCAKRPRKLDPRVETWTIRDSAVTCGRCLKLVKS